MSVQASGYRTPEPLEAVDGSESGVEGEPNSILYVGSLSERKGVLELLEIFATVQSQIREAKLVIVGDGPLRASVRERIHLLALHESVEMAGFVPPDDLGKYYGRARLFLFPSHEDTFGVVIAEAAAHGLPLVVSRYAGASDEFVRQGENGFIVDPKDISTTASAVLRILGDDGLRSEMGRKSYEITASHALDDAGDQFLEAIKLGAPEHRS